LQLTEDADRLVRTYSGGMRRRLDLGVSGGCSTIIRVQPPPRRLSYSDAPVRFWLA